MPRGACAGGLGQLVVDGQDGFFGAVGAVGREVVLADDGVECPNQENLALQPPQAAAFLVVAVPQWLQR